MPAGARQRPVSEKQNVPPFRAARGKHSMLAAVTVNTPRGARFLHCKKKAIRNIPGGVEKPNCNA